MDTDKIINFGIVGLGTAGSALVQPVLKNKNFRMAGAADLDKETLARFKSDFPEAGIFDSAEAIAEADGIDALFISTPTQFHTGHVLAAINNGKHVVTEKPIATNLDDADAMIEASEKAGVTLMVGHSFGYETPIKAIRNTVNSGELGPLRMLHNWYFTDWMYRPRNPEELDTSLGGGVTFRQGSHQFDIIRLIGGGLVRSVRAMTAKFDVSRPAEGAHTVFLEFENGAVATAIYSGYDRFRSAELGYNVGEGGLPFNLEKYGAARNALKNANPEAELELKKSVRYGGSSSRNWGEVPDSHPFYGLTVVSCENGDIRQSPDGLLVYSENEKREVAIPKGTSGRDNILTELKAAILDKIPPLHDGRWGKANLEVCLAALESSHKRKEIYLSHQKMVHD
ncbi:MAG: Gfo/Idh/MocA family oxidoreductase [Dehalococcoidia bacterium]|nr:Gfo/Idh/MocA family oxidoreductase [Dehalococcoidia bacterium]